MPFIRQNLSQVKFIGNNDQMSDRHCLYLLLLVSKVECSMFAPYIMMMLQIVDKPWICHVTLLPAVNRCRSDLQVHHWLAIW